MKQPPIAVAAVRDAAVLQQLYQDWRVTEAFSTRGLIAALENRPSPALVVLNPRDLIATSDCSMEMVRGVVQSARAAQVQVISRQQYLQAPAQYLGQAMLTKGHSSGIRYMPPQLVLLANWAGGVGKTTLSLAAARAFREQAGLPAAVLEAGAGASALSGRFSTARSLYDLLTTNEKPTEWESIALYPLDNRQAQVLAGDDRLPAFLQQMRQQYSLILVDAFPGHPFWPLLLDHCNQVVIVTSPREDALYQAEQLLNDLAGWQQARGVPVNLLLNMARTTGQRLALSGRAAATLPYNEKWAAGFDARLGESVLGLVYPHWQSNTNGGASWWSFGKNGKGKK